ncbi:hypothetical protein GY45DRAFT_249131 [Cubamyces sp. BRFM 1775]|nr:hypothetical protein GY45DRAFT_249131 [Cubamyces sp. BRFM 1775]
MVANRAGIRLMNSPFRRRLSSPAGLASPLRLRVRHALVFLRSRWTPARIRIPPRHHACTVLRPLLFAAAAAMAGGEMRSATYVKARRREGAKTRRCDMAKACRHGTTAPNRQNGKPRRENRTSVARSGDGPASRLADPCLDRPLGSSLWRVAQWRAGRAHLSGGACRERPSGMGRGAGGDRERCATRAEGGRSRHSARRLSFPWSRLRCGTC